MLQPFLNFYFGFLLLLLFLQTMTSAVWVIEALLVIYMTLCDEVTAQTWCELDKKTLFDICDSF